MMQGICCLRYLKQTLEKVKVENLKVSSPKCLPNSHKIKFPLRLQEEVKGVDAKTGNL